MASRDWASVKAAYLAGVEPADLAIRFRIPAATVRSRASRERWADDRTEVATRVQQDLAGEVARAVVERAVDEAIMGRDEVLRRLTAIARGGMHRVATWGPDGVILRDSAELEEEARALVSEVGETVNAFGKAVRVKVLDPVAALKELARHHGIAVDPKAGGLNGGNAGAPPATDEPRRELGTAELDERIAAAIARSRGGGA